MLKKTYATFVEEIDSFFSRDPAARSRLEIVLCYPGLHAIFAYRLTHWLWKKNWKLLARVISQLTRWFTGIEIHPAARIGKRLFIDHGMGVVIGETAYIGNDVTIYHGVTLGGVSPTDTARGALRHPQLGDGVIVGSGAQLLGPIQIGDYARVGSNAVVVSDVEAGTTVVGIPARCVKTRQARTEADHPFTAYAVPRSGVDDPLTAKVEALLTEVTRLQKRVYELECDEDLLEETAESWEGKRKAE